MMELQQGKMHLEITTSMELKVSTIDILPDREGHSQDPEVSCQLTPLLLSVVNPGVDFDAGGNHVTPELHIPEVTMIWQLSAPGVDGGSHQHVPRGEDHHTGRKSTADLSVVDSPGTPAHDGARQGGRRSSQLGSSPAGEPEVTRTGRTDGRPAGVGVVPG